MCVLSAENFSEDILSVRQISISFLDTKGIKEGFEYFEIFADIGNLFKIIIYYFVEVN